MKQTHLDTARLLAIRDGDAADIPAVEHLISCGRCRHAFDDTQWLALLAKLGHRAGGGEHPGTDALIAYRSGALSQQRLEEVGRHLQSCDRCLAVYRRERVLDSTLAYSSPSPKAVAQARRTFRPQLRQLGTVLVERLRDRLAVFFEPEPGPRERRLGQLRMAEMSPGPDRSEGHPARLEDGLDEMAVAGDIMDLAEPGGMALIGAGAYSLVLEPDPREDDTSLTLTVLWTDTDEPVEGVRVESARREGASGDVRTDPEGKVTLDLTTGRLEITVHVVPAVRFRLEFPD